MPLRNAFDRLTLGRRRGRSQDTAQPAGDLATRSGSPKGITSAVLGTFFDHTTDTRLSESSLPAQIPDPSTPSTTFDTPALPTRPVACTFSRDELSTLSKFPTPRLPTDPPPLFVTPAHMSSRRFRELLSTPPPALILGRGTTEGAAGHDEDVDGQVQEHLANQLPSMQPTTRGDTRNRQQIPEAWRVPGISERSDKPYRVLGIPNPHPQRIASERSELLHPLSPQIRQHPNRVQIFADTGRVSSSVQQDDAFLSRSHPHPHVVAPQDFSDRPTNNSYISNPQLSITSRPKPSVSPSNTAMQPAPTRRGQAAGVRVPTSSQHSLTPDHENPATMQLPSSRNDQPTGSGTLASTTNSASRDYRDRRGIGREVLNTPFGSSSLIFTNTNDVHPLMVGDPSGHQQGEASGSVGVSNNSSQHQARTHTVPILPSRFVSSSNFVEGHPGFQQPGFGLQQTGLQQTGFQQNNFQQNSFQQSNVQQSSFQQPNMQSYSFQQSRTRNMFDGSSSGETDETLREESPKRQQSQQSRTRNAFDGSSSAETPSSQRRDVHDVSYCSLLPPLQSTGRRIDEEVGSSLADNSDDGSVSNFHGDPTLSKPLPQRLAPVTVLSRIPQLTRLPHPPAAEAQTSSETMMYPPHPRYQHTSGMAEDENDRRMIAPDYRYLPGGIMTRRDAHDEPVEGTMASYTHPHPLRRPTPNPFATPPPRLVLGGRRVGEDDDVMMGRDEVGQMQYTNVGSAAAQSAAASDENLRAADEAANEAVDTGIASRHRYHRSDKSATSTEAEPPTTAPTRDWDGGVRRPAIRASILERHRQDLTAMGLLNPTLPLPAYVRPTHTFEIEEPAHLARGASSGSAALAVALGLVQGLRRMPDEEEMVSVPMGHHPLVEGPPRLLQTARAYRACLAEKQEMTSKAIFVLCGVFPPAWLLYACGGFDWYMRHVTRGAVEKISAEWKKRAWLLGVVWGLVTVVVFADILILSW